ncbi:uncharacterized protein zgc:113337 isoform X2 [Synchiropus splendidus]|uniref:uncharacterized protein zgc:113337 isoform X2 n=1 Tax=Synchiropus splendidus TaxID=270530 RepID=UPI00237DC26D|nr:uncharacterized protein zgc:113337 isoform X2 [Synchiropus splendidus]
MRTMMMAVSCRKDMLVFLLLLLVENLQGKVTAPARLEAPVEKPFTLTCSFTRDRGQTLRLVHWLDVQNKTLLTYQPGRVETLTGQQHVELATSPKDTSAVTIQRVGFRDEGCYTCIFEMAPSGTQQGQTCLTVTSQVTADRNKTALSGKKAQLSCSYGLPEKVQGITWRHTSALGHSADVASFAKQSDPMIEPPYQGRVWLSASLSDSRITIQPVAIQDEGCYTCLYNTHADGPKSSKVCLSIYVLPKPQAPGRDRVECGERQPHHGPPCDHTAPAGGWDHPCHQHTHRPIRPAERRLRQMSGAPQSSGVAHRCIHEHEDWNSSDHPDLSHYGGVAAGSVSVLLPLEVFLAQRS